MRLPPSPISRGQGLLIALAVGAAEILGYAGRWRGWLGLYGETHLQLSVALVFSLPAAAGAGAWVGAICHRRGLRRAGRVASRSRMQVVLSQVAPVWLWVSLGFLVSCSVPLLLTAARASYGAVDVPGLALNVVVLAAGGAGGYAIGWRLPLRLAGPMVGVGAYALLGLVVIAAESLSSALTPVDERWATFHRTPWEVLALQVLLWGLVLAAVLLRSAEMRRRSILAAWLAGVAAVPLILVGPADRVVDDDAVAMGCTVALEGVRVCLPAEKRYLAASLQRDLRDAHVAACGLLPDHVTFVDDEARALSAVADASIAEVSRHPAEVVFLSQFGDISAQAQYRRSALQLNLGLFLIGRPADASASLGADSTGRPHATLSDVVLRSYLERLNVPLDGSAEPGAPRLDDAALSFGRVEAERRFLAQLSGPARCRWLTEHARKIRRGELTSADFA